jgi:hypothetical protein
MRDPDRGRRRWRSCGPRDPHESQTPEGSGSSHLPEGIYDPREQPEEERDLDAPRQPMWSILGLKFIRGLLLVRSNAQLVKLVSGLRAARGGSL